MACRWSPNADGSEDAAVAAAEALGFPVAIRSKSTCRTRPRPASSASAQGRRRVRDAYRAVAHTTTLNARINALVQPMASRRRTDGRRSRRPADGPDVAGLGGVPVDDAIILALAPVTHTDARAMFGPARLGGAGRLPRRAGGLDRLADIVTRLSEFVADQRDRIAELDVNPIIVAGTEAMAVD